MRFNVGDGVVFDCLEDDQWLKECKNSGATGVHNRLRMVASVAFAQGRAFEREIAKRNYARSRVDSSAQVE